MKPITFITEVREFLAGLDRRDARRAFSTLITRQCQKNASRSQQLLVLDICIKELKAKGKKVPCVPSLDGSTSESSGSALSSTSDAVTLLTGSCEPASASTLPVSCDVN